MTEGYKRYLRKKFRKTTRNIKLYLYRHAVLVAIALFVIMVSIAVPLTINAFADDSKCEVVELEIRELEPVSVYEINEVQALDTEQSEVKAEENEVEAKENELKLDNYDKVTLYVITSKLNVRSEANANSDKLGALYIGDCVESLGYISGWYMIDYNGQDAFISEDYVTSENPFIGVESTAYWNQYNRPCANTQMPQANLTLAGKIAWLGKSCYLFKCNDDGSVGECIGYYEFHDTGYGQESGVGESVILSDKTVGTIENGTCIDIFMNTESECINYGRQNIYILFVEE